MSKKPGVVDDRIEAREYLHVGMMFVHDVVDGADAARFSGRLGELIKGSLHSREQQRGVVNEFPLDLALERADQSIKRASLVVYAESSDESCISLRTRF
jgi:hypothetical protein